jgi:hypothetical protein
MVPIEAAGIEPALADPERPGTLLDLVSDVTAVYWLLGSAAGAGENLDAIHGGRLERLLERLVETPVRRFVYEAVGSVDEAILERGAAVVRAAGARWRIPIAVIEADSDEPNAWVEAMLSAAETASAAEEAI